MLLLLSSFALLFLSSAFVQAAALSVNVFGGSGFVGSRVCKILATKDVKTVSISKSGKPPAWCQGEAWVDKIEWRKVDLLTADKSTLDDIVGSPDAVVSCVGAIGTDPTYLLKGNCVANEAAFASAKRGGNLQRACYVSVGSEVESSKGWLPEFFQTYFDGKIFAERAALESCGGDTSKLCIVKPTFIYGGNDFALVPPRVNNDYGSGVEEFLMLPPLKILADLTPGLIKVALRPPVSVDAVAAACAKAVMDETGKLPTLDGTDEINAYSGQPKSTGLTDALQWTRDKLIDFYDWAKVEVPNAIDTVTKKLEEAK